MFFLLIFFLLLLLLLLSLLLLWEPPSPKGKQLEIFLEGAVPEQPEQETGQQPGFYASIATESDSVAEAEADYYPQVLVQKFEDMTIQPKKKGSSSIGRKKVAGRLADAGIGSMLRIELLQDCCCYLWFCCCSCSCCCYCFCYCCDSC